MLLLLSFPEYCEETKIGLDKLTFLTNFHSTNFSTQFNNQKQNISTHFLTNFSFQISTFVLKFVVTNKCEFSICWKTKICLTARTVNQKLCHCKQLTRTVYGFRCSLTFWKVDREESCATPHAFTVTSPRVLFIFSTLAKIIPRWVAATANVHSQSRATVKPIITSSKLN